MLIHFLILSSLLQFGRAVSCPVVTCVAPRDGCRLDPSDENNDQGCPRYPCGVLVCPHECPQNCTTWYDGCNTCMCENGHIGACTEMACTTLMPTKCTAYTDTTPPVIEIVGDSRSYFQMSHDDQYQDPGATCSALQPGDMNAQVEISGNIVDLSQVGTYTVVYNCQDLAGNDAQQKERIVVVEKAVVCTLEYNPVCCTSTNESHGNPCFANAAKCHEFITGPCIGYNCHTREVWSDSKTAWCCEHENLGCTQEPCMIVDCAPGFALEGTDERGCGGRCELCAVMQCHRGYTHVGSVNGCGGRCVKSNESVVETDTDPVMETTEDPVMETTEDPVMETTEDPVETTQDPVMETTEDPVETTQDFMAIIVIISLLSAAIIVTLVLYYTKTACFKHDDNDTNPTGLQAYKEISDLKPLAF